MSGEPAATGTIDGVDVELTLERDVLVPGEPFDAEVTVDGADADRELPAIGLVLVASTPDEDAVGKIEVNSWVLTEEDLAVPAGETLRFPFEAVLHPEAPVTELDVPEQHVQLRFVLTLQEDDLLYDEFDNRDLRVRPTEPMAATLSTAEDLGLDFFGSTADAGTVTVEERESRVQFDQEFDFRPTEDYDGPQFDEYQLHVVPWPLQNATDVLLELERDDDRYSTLTIDHVLGVDRDRLVEELEAAIERAA